MSSITNVTTGSVSIADPLAIAYQAGGVDVPVTAADPLPITGTITTSQGPVQYVDSVGADVEVTEGSKPLPVSIEAAIALPAGPIEFKNVGGVDTVVTAGDKLTSLPIFSEGGVLDSVTTVGTVNTVDTVTTVATVNTVTEVANVTSVDTVDTVTTVGTVTTVASVTDVANVQNVDLVDLVTEVSNVTSVDTVDEVTKSIEWHLDATGTAVSTATNGNRQPVTDRGLSIKIEAVTVLDVGPVPGTTALGGLGKVFYTAPTWVRISHVGVRNDSTPGTFSLGIVDGGGSIAYSGEQAIKASLGLPGASCFVPNAYQQPFTLSPGDQLAVWHDSPGATATVHVNFTAEALA